MSRDRAVSQVRRAAHGTGPLAAWLLALACTALPSCATGKDGHTTLGPLYERKVSEGGDFELTVRPLFRHVSTAARPETSDRPATREKTETTVLWPLFRWTREGDDTRGWLFPIWSDRVFHSREDGRDHDALILPFFAYGSDEKRGRYFMFFPVAGRVNNLLAKEQIDIFAFPLYARIRDRDVDNHHILWPFIKVIRGEHASGFRFFPFYANVEKRAPDGAPRYEQFSILWPFFYKSGEYLDSPMPKRVWMSFPFYGETESTRVSRRMYLWPLVQYKEDRGRNEKELFVFPWKFGWGENLSQADYMPFYGTKKTKDYFRRFILWPIHRSEWQNTPAYTIDSFWIAPIYWSNERKYKEDGSKSKSVILWPLYSNKRARSGERVVAIPDLLPFRDPEHFEPLYSRLWQLFRAESRSGGKEREWELLWGVLRRRVDERQSSFSVLGGLIGWESTVERSRLRLLYIPITTRSEPAGS